MGNRDNGQFPATHFSAVLGQGIDGQAHSTTDMPTWGPLFRSRDINKDQSQLAIYSVVSYVESLQKN
jgi:hypothetical protein